jgi:hypothetical protein
VVECARTLNEIAKTPDATPLIAVQTKPKLNKSWVKTGNGHKITSREAARKSIRHIRKCKNPTGEQQDQSREERSQARRADDQVH